MDSPPTSPTSPPSIYFDEIEKVRYLNPQETEESIELKEACEIYLEKLDEFKKVTYHFIALSERLEEEVHRQKMKTILARSTLRNMDKANDLYRLKLEQFDVTKRLSQFFEPPVKFCKTDLEVRILERAVILGKLKRELRTFRKTEMDYNKILSKLIYGIDDETNEIGMK